MDLDELFKLIRESSSAITWSRGVELSRGSGVVGESLTTIEAVLRVTIPKRPVSATVKLLFEDEDWLCDCQSTQNPCEHVAAAVIALRRAKEQGKSLPVSSMVRGLVCYVFSVRDGAVWFERKIRVGEKETPVTGSLASYVSGASAGPMVSASKEDFAVDSLLPVKREGELSSPALHTLLNHLKPSKQVYFAGNSVVIGPPLSRLRARLSDEGAGVRLVFEKNPAITQEFKNGVVLSAEGLHSLAEPAFTPDELQLVRQGRIFGAAELARLVSDLLPKLRAKVPVVITSRLLPKTDDEIRPRLIFHTSASGDVLSVLPLIVYGEPPFARVDSGKLVFLGEVKTVPARDLGAETRLANSMNAEFGISVGRRVNFRGEMAERFSQRMAGSRIDVMGNGVGYFGIKVPLFVTLSFDDGALKVTFGQTDGRASVDSARVFQAWQEGLTRIPLEGNEGWAPLPLEWLERYGHRVLALLKANGPKGALAPFARPEAARLCDDLGVTCPPDFSRLRQQLETFKGIPVMKLPEDLKATLRPYQQRGVDWLNFLRKSTLGALLADDMGLGKTIQAMCIFSGRTLVVSPTSVLPNWQKELARFRPSLSVTVFHGADRELNTKSDVVLTTYALLRLDKDRLATEMWDTVVLDEAQNIKNPESQVAQAAFGLQSKFRTALTGTPIENRLEDLWSLFHFLNPGFLGARNEFQKRYGSASREQLGELRTKIKPFVLRRLKQEVAPELPPRTDQVDYCELDAEEQITYDAMKAATQKMVLDTLGKPGGVMAALECLLRLRQAACHTALLPGQSGTDSSKVKLLLERLDEVVSENHKALVFSQWTSLLDLIEPHLNRAGIRFCRIDGSTQDRAGVVEQFQSEEGPAVLLMTLKAGGVGLNLTAADYVFLVDPWWNPAAEDQAADRAHRIGQTRPVFVHRLVARGTVEEKILALQESKRAAATGALSEAENAAGITREDLLNLLR